MEFGKDTGYKDKNGNPIHIGDIIRFYFTYDLGKSPTQDEYESYTEMIDEVRYIDGDLYAWNHDIDGGGFLWRFNDVCEVIGNIKDNPELIESNNNG